MKCKVLSALICGAVLGWPWANAVALDLKLNNTSALVYFSPQDRCSEAIVKNCPGQGQDLNAENLLIIRNSELAAVYQENWLMHKEHAVRYESRQSHNT
jgi:hypothetical protein